jgi:hypothetical protein
MTYPLKMSKDIYSTETSLAGNSNIKMKLKTTLLGLCALCTSSLFAQKDSSHFVELGLNATRLYKSFGHENNSDKEIRNPYLLTAEWKPTVLGFRGAFGMNKTEQTELPGSANGNSTYVDDSASFDMRVGLVLYKNFNRRISMKYGVDYVSGKNSSGNKSTVIAENSDLVVNTNRLESKYSGFSPFIYFQYHVNDHFSLGTELLMMYTKETSTETITSSAFPTFSSEKNKELTSFRVMPPAALFLVVRF